MFKTHKFLSNARQLGYSTKRVIIFLEGRRSGWVIVNESGENIGLIYKKEADKPVYIKRKDMAVPKNPIPLIRRYCSGAGIVEPTPNGPYFRELEI